MTGYERLAGEVPAGEALRYHGALRHGGRVGLTDERLLVVRDGETTSVRHESVVEVTVDDFDWFVGLLSVAIVGFGILSLDRNVVLGLGFAVAGVVFLYRTYRRRGSVTVRVQNRPKPLEFHPEELAEFRVAADRLLVGSPVDETASDDV